MKKIVFGLFALFLVEYSMAATKKLQIKITDLKSGKIKQEISLPFWLFRAGAKIGNIVHKDFAKIDVAAIVKAIEEQGFEKANKGSFLTVKDYEDSQEISLSFTQ